jgi:OPA family glycerol-3-phosphate transporter-like MFS transporter
MTTETTTVERKAKSVAGMSVVKHTKEFRKRRAVNWLTLGFTYSAMYMGRYNLSFVNESLSKTYGWDKTQVGTIITSGLLIYGFSAIFNGPLSDRIGGRRSMLIGAIGTVVFNFLFGLGAYFGVIGTGAWLLGYFSTIWALNSFFQSYSALSLIKVNAGWFHITERGVFSAIFGAMIQMGRMLVYALGPILVVALPWQWMFFVPSMIVAIMAFLTYRNVQDSPEDCGLPEFDVQDATSGDTEKVSLKYVLKKVFTNPVTLTIAGAEFCTGLVRHGFEQWFPRYMTEAQHLPLDSAIFKGGALLVVAAGVLGAFTAGTMSDWVFKGRRPPVACLGYGLQVLCLAVVWRSPSIDWILDAFVV